MFMFFTIIAMTKTRKREITEWLYDMMTGRLVQRLNERDKKCPCRHPDVHLYFE